MEFELTPDKYTFQERNQTRNQIFDYKYYLREIKKRNKQK